MKFPTPEALRARFRELTEKREKILAKSAPLREERDRIANEARAKETALNKRIKTVEADLYENEQERAMIARALGGKTGEPEAEDVGD